MNTCCEQGRANTPWRGQEDTRGRVARSWPGLSGGRRDGSMLRVGVQTTGGLPGDPGNNGVRRAVRAMAGPAPAAIPLSSGLIRGLASTYQPRKGMQHPTPELQTARRRRRRTTREFSLATFVWDDLLALLIRSQLSWCCRGRADCQRVRQDVATRGLPTGLAV